MQEILFITSDDCVHALIEDLRSKLDTRIYIADDYSSGLKEIFDRHPAVAFIMKDTEGISVENLARQIKSLLDEDDVRLVLLQDESSQRYSKTANFDDSFDLCLPFEELTRQIEQMLRTIPGLQWKIPLPEEDIPAPLTEASPFFELDAPSGAEIVDVTIEPPRLEDYPSSFSLHDIINAEGPSLPSQPVKPDTAESPFKQEGPPPMAANQISSPGMEFRRTEKETPHQLFGSMTDEELNDILFRQPDSLSLPRPGSGAANSTQGIGQSGPSGKNGPAVSRTAIGSPQPSSSGFAARSTRQSSPSAQIRGSAGQKQQFEKKTSIVFKGYIVIAVLILSIATIFLVRQWYSDPGRRKQSPGLVKKPDMTKPLQTQPAPPPSSSDLPMFIPQVSPDSSYAASHPGWERYRADSLEYLIFREKGKIRAIQVVADDYGDISFPFLKLCLKEITGRGDFTVSDRKSADGFETEKGTLQNKGEVAIYRILPTKAIRGFVITYP